MKLNAYKTMKIGLLAVLAFVMALAPVSEEAAASGPDEAAFPQWGDLKPGPYHVGFRFDAMFDYSRTFATPKYNYEGVFQEGERARPVNINIWFPAKKAANAVFMPYEAYFYPAVPAGEKVSDQQKIIARTGVKNSPLAQTVTEEDFSKLMAMKTPVIADAVPADGPFPLIVIATGSNQFPTSQTIFCEYLASQGYVVALTRSRGQQGGMTNDLIGAEAQARDMEFIIAHMRSFPQVDKNKLGIAAVSFGGIAAATVAMRNTDVDAFLSMDSAIGQGFGFAILFQSTFYDVRSLRSAVFHLGRSEDTRKNVNFINALSYGDSYIMDLNGVRNADFNSWGKLATIVPNFAPFTGPLTANSEKAHGIMARHALKFFDAHVKRDEKAVAAFAATPATSELFVFTARKAQPAPPSENELAGMVQNGRIDDVVEIYKKFKKTDPDMEVFQENTMNNLGYQLLGQQRMDEAIEVFKLNVEAYPDSWNVYDSLGEAYAADGETDLAIKFYTIALEMNPDDQRIVGVLETLKGNKAGSPGAAQE